MQQYARNAETKKPISGHLRQGQQTKQKPNSSNAPSASTFGESIGRVSLENNNSYKPIKNTLKMQTQLEHMPAGFIDTSGNHKSQREEISEHKLQDARDIEEPGSKTFSETLAQFRYYAQTTAWNFAANIYSVFR